MISIVFKEAQFKFAQEYMRISQNKGIIGRDRIYIAYVDYPSKRIGGYKIVIVFQETIARTIFCILHELIHVLLNFIYGENEIGGKIDGWYENAWEGIRKRINRYV